MVLGHVVRARPERNHVQTLYMIAAPRNNGSGDHRSGVKREQKFRYIRRGCQPLRVPLYARDDVSGLAVYWQVSWERQHGLASVSLEKGRPVSVQLRIGQLAHVPAGRTTSTKAL